ncbi:lactate dehydrogenase-like 2-hydroxyacid dehydrogenase [Rhizobium sp. BK196]|uniref:2-hydroxyacid dehydrogenase n=1 Tax=unclassified Rhizobium TaxID=2613769 RepID=UPI0016229FC5|nr:MULTISPECIES: 2-hydroxyacid dehydrogenase [unclassified Rhizobium]MBB3312709.1 lactate dehydrogenase-like 2-hydroxyacid dehydrogenase [Rhizobium sp. BK196]MBB3463973.1 lactate dehydrogenase-like 2-hydroxyacid dehydrogenase [Rhizobium sp. BK377]
MPRIAVLVPGKIHDRVLARLKERFEVIGVERAETLALDAEVVKRIRGVAISGAFPAAWFEQLPALEIVASFGVGYDGIDAKLAGSKGIVVTNTPDVLNDEVADTAIALLLNAIRELPKAEAWLRDGNWKSGSAYPLTRFSLKGRHVGLYGLGRIGLEIAKRLEPFKVKISYHTRSRHADAPYDYHPTLKGLAEAVDTLIAIVPKTPQTHKTINAEVLSVLGPDGVVVNVGRGWTMDEDALIAALNAGTIGGAGLDVFYDEPNVPPGLLSAPNTVLVPHVGSASIPTRNAMADLVVENLISWFEQGKPVTPVAETPVKQ